NFAPFWSDKGHPPFELASPAIYSNNVNEKNYKKPQEEFLGWPSEGTLAHHEKSNFHTIYTKDTDYFINIELHNGKYLKIIIEPYKSNKILCHFPGGSEFIEKGKWSKWLTIPVGKETGIVRFKLQEYDNDKKLLTFFHSQINTKSKLSNCSE